MAHKIPDSQHEKLILKNFISGDYILNDKIFGNIPLKVVDFTRKEFYQMLTVGKPDDKRQESDYLLDKLRVMFDVTYTTQDF